MKFHWTHQLIVHEFKMCILNPQQAPLVDFIIYKSIITQFRFWLPPIWTSFHLFFCVKEFCCPNFGHLYSKLTAIQLLVENFFQKKKIISRKLKCPLCLSASRCIFFSFGNTLRCAFTVYNIFSTPTERI